MIKSLQSLMTISFVLVYIIPKNAMPDLAEASEISGNSFDGKFRQNDIQYIYIYVHAYIYIYVHIYTHIVYIYI